MTAGLVVLLAWAEFALLVATLAFWVLRAQNRDPLAEAERGTAVGPQPMATQGDARQRHIEALLAAPSHAPTRRFPPGQPGNESRRHGNRGEDSSDGTEGT